MVASMHNSEPCTPSAALQQTSRAGAVSKNRERVEHCSLDCLRFRRIGHLHKFDTRHDGKGPEALTECHRRPVGRPHSQANRLASYQLVRDSLDTAYYDLANNRQRLERAAAHR